VELDGIIIINNNKIEPLRVSANGDDHQKAINTSGNGRHWPKHVKALFCD
jgi:hypothetical protein